VDDATRLKAFKYLEGPLFSPGRVLFPSHIDKLLTGLMETELGPQWFSDPEVASWLKPAFQEVFLDTLGAVSPVWTREKYLAYLLGMGPFHFHKVPIVLREMLRCGLLGSRPELRILDIGAGPGIASLSLLYFFELYANSLNILDIMGDEGKIFLALSPLDATKEALDLYSKIIYGYMPMLPNLQYDVSAPLRTVLNESSNVKEVLGDERYDLILMSHFISELRDQGLDRRAQFVVDLSMHLAPGGSVVLVETSTAGGIQTANQLKSRVVNKGLDIYGPCTHIFSKPAGPICFTCSMSRKDEVAPPRISQQFCSVVGGAAIHDLVSKNQWTYSVFRKDGVFHHQTVPVVEEQIPRITDIAKRKTSGRGHFYVQIARRETEPFLYYKVCDQSAKSDECYLTFEVSNAPHTLELGDLVHLKNVRIDFGKRAGAETFRNSFYLVVDAQSEIVDLTREAKSLPTRAL